MVDERSEYYMNLVPGIKKWDMCASEAIINSRMGVVSDSQKNPLDYNSEQRTHTLKKGNNQGNLLLRISQTSI